MINKKIAAVVILTIIILFPIGMPYSVAQNQIEYDNLEKEELIKIIKNKDEIINQLKDTNKKLSNSLDQCQTFTMQEINKVQRQINDLQLVK